MIRQIVNKPFSPKFSQLICKGKQRQTVYRLTSWFKFDLLYQLCAHGFPAMAFQMLSLSVLHPNNAVWIMWLNCWLVYDLSDSLNSHVFYPLFAAMSHIPRSYQLMWKCNLSIIINRNDSQDYTNKTQVKINQNDRYVYIYIYTVPLYFD